jgi:predicted anti-sigma-YlaC factor YlaD
MWKLKRSRHQEDCKRLRDLLEDATGAPVLSAENKEHVAACPECKAVADDMSISRALFRDVPASAALPGPWFAPRVMAAIAARESELRHSLEAWAAVPRFAARLTWISALALLLAGGWLYESPKPAQTSVNQPSVESIFDSPQSQTPDELLLERAQ